MTWILSNPHSSWKATQIGGVVVTSHKVMASLKWGPTKPCNTLAKSSPKSNIINLCSLAKRPVTKHASCINVLAPQARRHHLAAGCTSPWRMRTCCSCKVLLTVWGRVASALPPLSQELKELKTAVGQRLWQCSHGILVNLTCQIHINLLQHLVAWELC